MDPDQLANQKPADLDLHVFRPVNTALPKICTLGLLLYMNILKMPDLLFGGNGDVIKYHIFISVVQL